ncbi:MAG: class I SAM-dependent methyltransferase [Negativicutes bacterium]|nr:class I SAM-dependent methyltransferase [Negativicutes bacterium]
MKLGSRMAAIAAMIPAGSRVADIGTDHAYLPIHLVTSGVITSAVAGDVHHGPYQSALAAIGRMGLDEQISVRLGDGLAVLSPGEADTAIIAGMGGPTMIGILSDRPDVTRSLSRLVLQPMLAAGAVRRWLVANGWHLVDENLVEEDGRIYEIIAAEQGLSGEVEPVLYDIGPLLWACRHPLLKDHLAGMIGQLKRVVAEMADSACALNSPRYREYCEQILLLEEKWACL